MMEKAVTSEGRVLIIATHGPTVKNTRQLLLETSKRLNKNVEFEGATVEEAFHLPGEGKIEEHNKLLSDTIEINLKKSKNRHCYSSPTFDERV